MPFQKKSLVECQLAQEMTAENVENFSWASLIDEISSSMPFFLMILTAVMPTTDQLQTQDLRGKYVKRYSPLIYTLT
jgi:hypothetical protein